MDLRATIHGLLLGVQLRSRRSCRRDREAGATGAPVEQALAPAVFIFANALIVVLVGLTLKLLLKGKLLPVVAPAAVDNAHSAAEALTSNTLEKDMTITENFEPVERVSPFSFERTLTQLRAALLAADMRIFSVIDHADNARQAGLSMPPSTVLIYGKAAAGTPDHARIAAQRVGSAAARPCA